MNTPVMWAPTAEEVTSARMSDFMSWVTTRTGRSFDGFQSLHAWSVENVSEFWDCVRCYFDVIGSGFDTEALVENRMPGAVWYPNAQLNFAENILRWAESSGSADKVAIIEINELDETTALTWTQLAGKVGALGYELKSLGVKQGDLVAAVLPNLPEALIGMLACASIGAIWSVSSPDLSVPATLSRLQQLQPKILLATNGYRFNARDFDCVDKVHEILLGLPSVQTTIWIDGFRSGAVKTNETSLNFDDMVSKARPVEFSRVGFDQPLWVLFSSGTTGAPKGIVHSHGGILLEAYKAFGLMHDLSRDDTFYVAANTSWMVWNTLSFALAVGATTICYSGSPLLNAPDRQFRIIADQKVTFFATGAAYLTAVEKSMLIPNEYLDLSSLRSILSTGSPLPDSTWQWVHQAIKKRVHLGSDSGGTDICSGFIGSNPLEPVVLGVLQGPALGVAIEAVDSTGKRVFNALGEMVITKPLPSMPLYFWGDEDGSKYREAYFEQFPGLWTHGDWITELSDGGFIVHGRSDATLNRDGVRLGTAEIYAALAFIPQVTNSLVIGVERQGGEYYMPLFVQLADGVELTEELRLEICEVIKLRASARHVPDEVISVPAIPVTHAGKKIETQIRKLFAGMDSDKAIAIGALANPESVEWFRKKASEFRTKS